jgi:hypothetical protein
MHMTVKQHHYEDYIEKTVRKRNDGFVNID